MTAEQSFPGDAQPALPATFGDLQAQRATHKRQAALLPTVRASAERWATAVTGILAALGITTLLSTPEKLESLAAPWDVVGTALVLIGGLLGIAALWLSYSAAQIRFEPGPVSGHAQVDHDRIETDRAIGKLQAARWLTAVSVAALLTASGVLWLAPPNSSDTRLRGLTPSGTIICGTLEKAGDQPVIRSAKAPDQALRSVRALRAVDSC